MKIETIVAHSGENFKLGYYLQKRKYTLQRRKFITGCSNPKSEVPLKLSLSFHRKIRLLFGGLK